MLSSGYTWMFGEASHTGEVFDALEKRDSTLRIKRAPQNYHITSRSSSPSLWGRNLSSFRSK